MSDDSPRGTLITKFGAINYTMTSGEHVCLHTGDGQSLTIFGVRYHVNAHLNLIDGQWRPKDYRSVYMARLDDRLKDATRAGHKAAERELTTAWPAHLAENPALTDNAELAKAIDDRDRAAALVAGYEEKLKAARAEHDAAVARIRQFLPSEI